MLLPKNTIHNHKTIKHNFKRAGISSCHSRESFSGVLSTSYKPASYFVPWLTHPFLIELKLGCICKVILILSHIYQKCSHRSILMYCFPGLKLYLIVFLVILYKIHSITSTILLVILNSRIHWFSQSLIGSWGHKASVKIISSNQPGESSITKNRFPRAMPTWVLNICGDGDSTSFLGNLLHCLNLFYTRDWNSPHWSYFSPPPFLPPPPHTLQKSPEDRYLCTSQSQTSEKSNLSLVFSIFWFWGTNNSFTASPPCLLCPSQAAFNR